MFYELLRESPLLYHPWRWWSVRVLVGKHKFIIIIRGAGRRPSTASCPEEGVFCFWPFFKGSHSLCGRINVFITIVIGAQGRSPIEAVTNDSVAHFFRTTATLIFLPSTKKRARQKWAGGLGEEPTKRLMLGGCWCRWPRTGAQESAKVLLGGIGPW